MAMGVQKKMDGLEGKNPLNWIWGTPIYGNSQIRVDSPASIRVVRARAPNGAPDWSPDRPASHADGCHKADLVKCGLKQRENGGFNHVDISSYDDFIDLAHVEPVIYPATRWCPSS